MYVDLCRSRVEWCIKEACAPGSRYGVVLCLSTCCGKIHNPDDSMVPWYLYMQCFRFSWWCWWSWWCGCELRQVREAKEELRNTVSSASAGYVRNPFEDLADLAQKKMQGTLWKGRKTMEKQSPVDLTHWPSCSAYVLWVGTLVMRQSPPMSWSSAGRWCNNMLPKVPWDWDCVAVQVETEASKNWSLCMLKGSPDILTSLFWQCANKLLLHAPTRCVIVSGRSPQQNSDCWNSGVVSATTQTHEQLRMFTFERRGLKGAFPLWLRR